MTNKEFVSKIMDAYIKYYDMDKVYLVSVGGTIEGYTRIFFMYTQDTSEPNEGYVDFLSQIDENTIRRVFEEIQNGN